MKNRCDHVPKPRTFDGWRAVNTDASMCDCQYAELLEDIAVIDANPQFEPQMLHTIAARIGQLGYQHKTILWALKSVVKLDPEWFPKEFPEWCWENFTPYVAGFVAFGSDYEKAQAERTVKVKDHSRRGKKIKGHERKLPLRTRYI